MKIFISWSGARSRAVAELFNSWIKCVLQACKPWISTHDIESGELWFPAINAQLSGTETGIVCLTQDNKAKPWILFEAGALAKGLSTNRVCTFLIDLEPADVDDPLAQFNHTFPHSRESLFRLVQTLNNRLENDKLDGPTLAQVFTTNWPSFELALRTALEQNPLDAPLHEKSEPEILKQILEGVRSLNTRVGRLETVDDPRPKRVFRNRLPIHPKTETSPARSGFGALLESQMTEAAEEFWRNLPVSPSPYADALNPIIDNAVNAEKEGSGGKY